MYSGSVISDNSAVHTITLTSETLTIENFSGIAESNVVPEFEDGTEMQFDSENVKSPPYASAGILLFNYASVIKRLC